MALQEKQNTASPKKGKKYFTISESNLALCLVSKIVDDLSVSYRQAVKVRQRIEHTSVDIDLTELKSRYETEMGKLNGFIDELQQVGVELKDFEKCILDFPAMHEGREIYLCWHKGEDKVNSWHELDQGMYGRKDISLLVNARSTAAQEKLINY